MKSAHLFLLVFGLFVGAFLYTQVLPYHFSPQAPLPVDLGGDYDRGQEQGSFHGKTTLSFFIPNIESTKPQVLGDQDNKRIEVDLTNQRVYAYEGGNRVFEFIVSTGKWALTPTGSYRIWTKLRYTKMSGGSQALGTYYYLPNVPFVMYFYKGYGLHGTYWHNNFGNPMSHGCVNMRTEDAGTLFNWAEVGTPVIVYGVTPRG